MGKSAQKNKSMLGKFGKILDVLPDMTEILSDAVREAAPLIEKSMDRQYEKQQSLVTLPNLIDIEMTEAKEILEELGFRVVVLRDKPHARHIKRRPNEVVATVPKKGQVQPGSVVKLYYVTADIIEESRQEVEKQKSSKAHAMESLLGHIKLVFPRKKQAKKRGF